MKLLTKTDYVEGLSCLSYLWIKFNAPERLPPKTLSQLNRFEQGRETGDLAKRRYPDGISCFMLESEKNVEKTEKHRAERKPLFESGVIVDNLHARADIFLPVGEDEWDIIEVKSSTSIDKEYYHDVSFQKYCFVKAGYKIRNCHLMILNKEYIKHGDLNLAELFVIENVDDKVDAISEGIQERIVKMVEIINSATPPARTAKDCCKPKDCKCNGECWNDLPDGNIFELYNSRKTVQFFDSGLKTLTDVPPNERKSNQQQIQCACAENGKQPHIDKKSLQEFLDKLEYPLYLFDFETFSTAIPIFDGTNPHYKVPFQYSLHIVSRDGKIIHKEFLSKDNNDPRAPLLTQMKEDIGTEGSVVVYNQSFEKGVLTKLAEAFPESKEWVENVILRFVDLRNPFSAYAYYNPSQRGSASIKKILPALTGKSYDGMNIDNGDEASIKFYKVTFKQDPKFDREQVYKDLEEYCCLDTEGMWWIIKELEKLCS